jgi:hypothetical protein
MIFNMLHGNHRSRVAGGAPDAGTIVEDGLRRIPGKTSRTDAPWGGRLLSQRECDRVLTSAIQCGLIDAANLNVSDRHRPAECAVWLLRNNEPEIGTSVSRTARGMIPAWTVCTVTWALTAIRGFQQFRPGRR